MHRQPPARVGFGPFQLDLRAGELRRNDRSVVLHQQPFQVLLMLVELEGEIVTREEIKKKLWPNDTVVEFDHSINAAIKKLRRDLDDSADAPKYIETVARRGYRLMVPVTWVEPRVADNPPAVADAASAVAARVPDNTKAGIGALTGKTVSHYRVLDIVGGGGMGLVYRAEDLKLGRVVALKFLPEEMGSDPRALERFEREARAVSALSHPNICPIFEFDDYEGQPFIVMELLRGLTLREHIAAGGFRLSDQAGLDIAIQIAAGLEAAHEKGIIHRDIKPANIFITEKSVAKILDFGVAKILEAAAPQELAGGESETDPASVKQAALNVTRPGLKLGTAGYMSPEQVRGEALDVRTDIFSFGLVLYEMATGERAFTGETEAILHDAIENREPTPLRELAPDISPSVETIILKCLRKDKSRRPQSVAEVFAELSKIDNAREQRPPSLKLSRHALVAAAVFLLAIIGGALYWRSITLRKATKLARTDTVVVADFLNLTGDKSFDGGLGQALRIALVQSPFLNVLSQEKVVRTLQQLDREVSSLTYETAREVCSRTNSRAVVSGSISDVGNFYRIDLRAVECKRGQTLANTTAETSERKQIVHALGVAAHQLRESLGEPAASLRDYNTELELATTSSIEALNSWSQGNAIAGTPESIPYCRRAVELDPEFAIAHSTLAVGYYDVGDSARALESDRKAYALRDRGTAWSRFQIESSYYMSTGETEKQIQVLGEWRKQFHLETVNLSLLYRYLGLFPEAAEAGREEVRTSPDNIFGYLNLISSYIALDQYDAAQSVIDNAKARKLNSIWLNHSQYRLAFVRNDRAAMQKELISSTGKTGIENLLLGDQSNTESYYGSFRKAHEFAHRAAESARSGAEPSMAAFWIANEALHDAEVGNVAVAHTKAGSALTNDAGVEARLTAALAFAKCGDAGRVHELLERVDREAPLSTLMQRYSLPLIRAALEIQRNNPEKAIELLKATIPYELGGSLLPVFLYPAYERGLAFLQAQQGQAAAHEFQKLINHPGIVENTVTGALAHLQLGRAQAMMDDKEGARKSYEDFLTLWKDADPDIPIYKQAKAEYAKLR